MNLSVLINAKRQTTNTEKEMKKIVRTLCLVAMVALVATSCRKNEESTKFEVKMGETYGFEVGPSLDGSKAYFDPNSGWSFKWSDDDKLVVYNLSSDWQQSKVATFQAAPGSQGQQYTTFSTTEEIGQKKDLGFFAFYNLSKAHKDIKEGNRETFEVSKDQYYEGSYRCDPTAMVMASTVEDADSHHLSGLFMQHIFGYLDVAIADNVGGKKVREIIVTDKKWNLTGQLSLLLPEVSASEFTNLMNLCATNNSSYLTELNTYLNTLGYSAQGDGKTITLHCGDFQLPWRQWQYFLISLRPGALYKGFIVRINYSDGTWAEKEFDPVQVDCMPYLIKPAWIRNVYFTTAQGFLQ
jgi:hypothetical protein